MAAGDVFLIVTTPAPAREPELEGAALLEAGTASYSPGDVAPLAAGDLVVTLPILSVGPGAHRSSSPPARTGSSAGASIIPATPGHID